MQQLGEYWSPLQVFDHGICASQKNAYTKTMLFRLVPLSALKQTFALRKHMLSLSTC